VACKITGLKNTKHKNKNTQTSSTEVPRYLWNKLGTVPTLI
jgi:hypothetical protein